jgi:phytoene dehydrogenase-like protein
MARALPAPRRGAAPLCAPPTPPPPRRGRAAARACPAAPPRAPARRHRPAAAAPPPPRRGRATARAGPSFASSDSDVVVVGAGVGGLSCAALLAMHGLDVTVAEAHTVVGGAAHAYSRRGFHFESGPSLYAGMAARGAGANPLAHVLQAIEEPLELVEYAEWQVFCPEVPGGIVTTTGARGFDELLTRAAGPEALRQWRAFQAHVEPLSRAATALPPAAIRLDAGVVRSAARFLPALARAAPRLGQLTGPFSNVMDAGGLTDLFARNWCDLLCWLLSGLDSRGTIAAEVAFMFAEW